MKTNEKIFYQHLIQELNFYQNWYIDLIKSETNTTNQNEYNKISMKRKSVTDTIEELQELISIYKALFNL